MNRYSLYYPKILEMKEHYEDIQNKVLNIKDKDKKLEALISLIYIYVNHNFGYWTSSQIEKSLIEYAEEIETDINIPDYQPNSYLHVMTTGYGTGGHTRVIERWINNSPEEQVHSIVYTEPNNYNNDTLNIAIKHRNGQITYFNNHIPLQEKVKLLRQIGQNYQYIILHSHMDDIIPTMAFGTEKFTRPVLLYNHASHLFWIGKSIADLVLDIKKNDEITLERRNIKNSYFLGVPSKEIKFSKTNKLASRKKLGLPLDKKIIVSSGGDPKYSILEDNNYAQVIEKLIDKDTYCYIIGMKPNNKQWAKYIKMSNSHIKPLGFINFNDGYLDYILSADLYIDSYPICSGTAVIDAISFGIPALSLKSPDTQFDYLACTEAYCKTKDEFVNKAHKILNNKSYADEIITKLQSSLNEYQSIFAWNNKIETLTKIIPQKHTVRDLSQETDKNIIDDLTVLDNVITDKNFLKSYKVNQKSLISFDELTQNGILYKRQGIPYIFEILSYKKAYKKHKIIKLLNIKLYDFKI